MSEKRKPEITMLLRKQGKANKIEIFKASLWTQEFSGKRYRLRVNGKWWPKGKPEYFTKTQTKELVFRSIKIS